MFKPWVYKSVIYLWIVCVAITIIVDIIFGYGHNWTKLLWPTWGDQGYWWHTVWSWYAGLRAYVGTGFLFCFPLGHEIWIKKNDPEGFQWEFPCMVAIAVAVLGIFLLIPKVYWAINYTSIYGF